MAFDNGFRISVVMTSNINDLVTQTHGDFSLGLPGLMMFTKDNDLDPEVANTRLHLERGNGHLLLVCSKGATSLGNISDFLQNIGAERFPTILFDDEGDQASLDTNTRRRSRTSAIAVAPSAINAIIQTRLRTAVPRHIYVSVTGTPQAILLQSADASHRPSFIVMLPPGATYIGGDRFFSTVEPEDNEALIRVVAVGEQQQLLDETQPIPIGLRQSILFFLVSAGAAVLGLGLGERGYSYLCHPSLRNDEQAVAYRRINDFLLQVYRDLLGGGPIAAELEAEHRRLRRSLGTNTPRFAAVRQEIVDHLPSRRLLVINARVKRQGIAYGRGFNFLIGGNTLGRGIAIRDLLVTYYVRDARISQIDTMHQHARMYGYRDRTLAYTRLFIPRHLYYRFYDIHSSDVDLRQFIVSRLGHLPNTFPIEFTFDLRTTRPGVLDVNKVDTLNPGKQIFPNQVIVPQQPRSYRAVLASLGEHFGVSGSDEDTIEAISGAGVEIDAQSAVALAAQIRTQSRNTWRDASIGTIIEKVAEASANRVILRFRTANRRVGVEGLISTGTLSGDELISARAGRLPTLWIMATTTTSASAAGGGLRFMYPTFVVPSAYPSLFMFNRGS